LSDVFVFSESLKNKSKRAVSAFVFILLVAFLNTLIFFRPTISLVMANVEAWGFDGVLVLITLFLLPFIASIVLFYLLMLINKYVAKIIISLILLLNACFLFYIEANNTGINASVLNDVFLIDYSELVNFINIKVLVYLFFYGLLPCLLVFRFKINPFHRGWLSLKVAMICLFLSVLVVLSYQSLLWIDKNLKQLDGLVLPWSYIMKGVGTQFSHTQESKELQLLPDAKIDDSNKTVVVLVIGESARAANFSLYGYERDTNPRLKEAGVIALDTMRACDTHTLNSVNCLLSLNKVGFKHYESLPNYLQRNNVEVWWRSNNDVEPNFDVSRYETSAQIRGDCTREGCQTDEVLMRGLVSDIESSAENNILIVLHQSGSQGPTYNKQYPKFFETFSPVCESAELVLCDPQAVVNAYDNTIVYQDFVLSSVVEQLKQVQSREVVMIYLSDHGESLGGLDLFGHGTSKYLAPDEQLDVPFILWMSDRFKENHNVSEQMLLQRTAHSYRNVFHSVMGAFDMSSEFYESQLDVFDNTTY